MMAQGVTYDGIPLMITNVGDEPSTLVVEHIIEHELYYKEPAKSFYKPFPDNNTLTIPSGETIHVFGYFIDVTTSNYAHFTFTGGKIHLEGSIRAIKSKASSVDVSIKARYYSLFSQNLNIISTSRDLFKEFDGVPLEENMFAYIFSGCSNLETAPDLYGKNNSGHGFEGSFRSCQNLKKLPVIYCNNVRVGTFRYTFSGCSSMDMIEEVTVPHSGGTAHTYTSMFEECKSLTKLPNFTENGSSYCSSMFCNCTSITDASNITLGVAGKAPASVAYTNMFYGCTNLVHAPKILVTTLGDERPSYWGAFNACFAGCINLDKLEVNFKDFTPTNFASWMRNVSPTGTFTCPKELGQALEGYYQSDGTWVEPTVSRGESTVPAGWYINYPIIDARDGDANAMALMAVISQQTHTDGTPWVKDSLVMMKSEAEKVEDIGTLFKTNVSITDFTALSFFSITSFAQTALESCRNLLKLQLPITTTSIGYRAFRATAITSLYIPDNVTFIDGGITAHCKNVTSLTVSPNNTKYYSGEYNAIIEKDTHKFIMGCNASIIPSDTKVIGKGAFNGIPITQVVLPEGLEEIETMAFAEYQGNELIIPSSVNTIGSQALYNTKLTSLILPDGLVRMEGNLVSHSANLTSLYIPASVTFIGNGCMNNCKKLTTINFGGTMSQWKGISTGNNWNLDVPTDCVIYCTDGELSITDYTE